jgi:hypothetical protein
MVTIHFNLFDIDSVQVRIDGPEKFERVLQRCTGKTGIELDSYIAVRKNRVLKNMDLVEDLDKIEIYPALSGG